MTPHFSASQGKIRLIAVFVFTLLLVLALQWARLNQNTTAGAADARMFMGIQRVSPAALHKAIPDIQGRPAVIAFHSRLCHDCKRMAPVLEQLMPQYPVAFRKYDILDDKKTHPAVFQAFKPVTVPVLVFVDRQGTIRNVLYNYQKPEAIRAAITQVLPAKRPAGKAK